MSDRPGIWAPFRLTPSPTGPFVERLAGGFVSPLLGATNVTSISGADEEDLIEKIRRAATQLETLREDNAEHEAMRRFMRVDVCPSGFIPCDEALMKSLGSDCPATSKKGPQLMSKNGPCFTREEFKSVVGEATTVDGLMRKLSKDIQNEMEVLKKTNFPAFQSLVLQIKQASETWQGEMGVF